MPLRALAAAARATSAGSSRARSVTGPRQGSALSWHRTAGSHQAAGSIASSAVGSHARATSATSASVGGGSGGVTPPALTSTHPRRSSPERSLWAPSAYVHIPFCRRRCYYCDFPISVVGNNTASASVADGMEAYVSAVCSEIQLAAAACKAEGGAGAERGPLRTVFIGGGTPSLLPPPQLGRILDAFRSTFSIADGAEISLEMDPGTFDRGKLEAFLDLGVSRINLGIQSFSQKALSGVRRSTQGRPVRVEPPSAAPAVAATETAAGRAHNADDGERAVHLVSSSGVRSWGLDLISGLPHQTVEAWEATLRAAIEANPQHVSVYDLQVEEGTAFGRWYQPGAAPLPSDESAAEMYRLASRHLGGAGLEHYEVSNYARPGHRCEHNLQYWKNGPWHAFGVAATSHIAGRRFARPRRLKDYEAWVRDGAAGAYAQPSAAAAAGPAGQSPVAAADEEAEERLTDALMLGLRLADGIDLAALRAQYGANSRGAVVADTAEKTLRQFVPTFVTLQPGANARLTVPEGFLVSNDVISTLFAALPPRAAWGGAAAGGGDAL